MIKYYAHKVKAVLLKISGKSYSVIYTKKKEIRHPIVADEPNKKDWTPIVKNTFETILNHNKIEIKNLK